MADYVVCTFYRFVTVDDVPEMRQQLLHLLQQNEMRGTILLAGEGINGTVAGAREAVDALKSFLQADARFAGMVYKESPASEMPFKRSKVKIKKEIVAGVGVGEGGRFENAVNPQTQSFREFPEYVEKNLAANKQTKVAMFCTGGIRCEKSTAYLKNLGFDEVYHLEGGILKYLEEVPEEKSLWRGECFVFDERVTVNHDLQRGDFVLCRACRKPLSKAEQQSDKFVPGVSCPHCYDRTSDEKKARFAERERQMQLAEQRSEPHLGAEAAKLFELRRREKVKQGGR